jgi:RNA polymerase sigma factor (sigma-70 family)
MASLRLSVSHGHLRTLFREGAVGALTDGELLERFAASHGEAAEAAFAVLVERHAPMVRATCRHLLGDSHDAEDAAQAAFLVLARKARTIRNGRVVGGWLHAVAVRIASKAKVAAARRRKHEERRAEMAARRADAPDPPDRWAELHAQIDRLPDRLRLPIVLCYLEGLTHAEAAHQLGWPVGTVESRLARGRERLKERLTARGATAMIPLLGPSGLPELSPAASPAAWIEATARAATQFAAGDVAASIASANAAAMARGMIGSLGWHQARLAIGYVLAVAIVAGGVMAAFRAGAPKASAVAQQEGRRPAAPAPEKPVTPSPLAPTTIKLGGRVLDPDGRPLAGAKLWLAFQGIDWTWSSRVPQVRDTTGPDGRFHVAVADDDPEVKRALRMTSGWPGGFGAIQLVVTADGLGPTWIDLVGAKGEVELRLIRDDVPIEGRLIGLEGRPLLGIEVRTLRVEDSANPMHIYGAPSGYFRSAKTDGDGRFRLTGIGRDRRVVLGIAGPGIQRDGLQVETGSFPKDRPPQYKGYPVHGAKFEHPCKPGKSISGVVRDRDSGAPIPGVAVRSLFAVSAQTTTDREGRYRLDGLSKNASYTLNASASASDQPYITTERAVADSPGYEPMTADIVMVRGVVVTGRLIDRTNGRPVQAWVAYTAPRDNPYWARLPGWIPTVGNGNRPSPGWHVPSMADGSYRIVVPPGRGFLVAHIQYQPDRYIPAGIPSKRHPGAPADALDMHYDTVPFGLFPSNFPAVCPVDIAPGTVSATYDLTFDSGLVRTGRVMDPEGRPLSGVSLVGESHEFGSLFAFKPLDGSQFSVYGLSPSPLLPRTLIFRHADGRLGKTVRVNPRDSGPLEVRLEPTASVTGRLLDAMGRPCEGIGVRVLRLIDEPTRGAQLEFIPPIQATTDADGRFRIDGIVPGAVQELQAVGFQAGPGGFLLEDWTPKPGEVKDLGEIRPQVGRAFQPDAVRIGQSRAGKPDLRSVPA